MFVISWLKEWDSCANRIPLLPEQPKQFRIVKIVMNIVWRPTSTPKMCITLNLWIKSICNVMEDLTCVYTVTLTNLFSCSLLSIYTLHAISIPGEKCTMQPSSVPVPQLKQIPYGSCYCTGTHDSHGPFPSPLPLFLFYSIYLLING